MCPNTYLKYLVALKQQTMNEKKDLWKKKEKNIYHD